MMSCCISVSILKTEWCVHKILFNKLFSYLVFTHIMVKSVNNGEMNVAARKVEHHQIVA